MAYGEFALDVILTLMFAAVTLISFRAVANRQKLDSLAASLGAGLQRAPRWVQGSGWGYSPSALRWYAFAIGLASLNFVFIAVHLTLLVFLSVMCFILMPLVAGFKTHVLQLRHQGPRALTRPRTVEMVAWGFVFFYTIGVLFLARALLLPSAH